MNTRGAKGLASILIAGLLLAHAPAQACKCAPQPLARSYDSAAVVVIASVTSAEAGEGKLDLLVAPQGEPYKGAVQADTVWRTADSSAACGLDARPGEQWLLFGEPTEEDNVYRATTCNGSRRFDPAAPPLADFVDAAAADVPARLLELQGAAALAELPSVDGADPANTALIGLLEFKRGFGSGLRVYAAPSVDAEPRVDAGQRLVLTRELSYEQPAAVVRAILPEWYGLAAPDGRTVWLATEAAGTFHAYDQLPVNRLAWIGESWNKLMWPDAPGSGRVLRATAEEEAAVEVHESARVDGRLWFRVSVLAESPCEGGRAVPTATGWVPAYTSTGETAVWYYSRGC